RCRASSMRFDRGRPSRVGRRRRRQAIGRNRRGWQTSAVPATVIVGAQWGDEGKGKDRKSTRLNSSHVSISYAVFCLKKKTETRPDKEEPKAEHRVLNLPPVSPKGRND